MNTSPQLPQTTKISYWLDQTASSKQSARCTIVGQSNLALPSKVSRGHWKILQSRIF